MHPQETVLQRCGRCNTKPVGNWPVRRKDNAWVVGHCCQAIPTRGTDLWAIHSIMASSWLLLSHWFPVLTATGWPEYVTTLRYKAPPPSPPWPPSPPPRSLITTITITIVTIVISNAGWGCFHTTKYIHIHFAGYYALVIVPSRFPPHIRYSGDPKSRSSVFWLGVYRLPVLFLESRQTTLRGSPRPINTTQVYSCLSNAPTNKWHRSPSWSFSFPPKSDWSHLNFNFQKFLLSKVRHVWNMFKPGVFSFGALTQNAIFNAQLQHF